jgi:hypothetical protein
LFDEDDYKDGNDAGRNVWNNQLLEFDIAECKWSLIPKAGKVPSQRAAAGASYVSDLHSVFLFGGRDELCRLNDLYRLDMFSKYWTKMYATINYINTITIILLFSVRSKEKSQLAAAGLLLRIWQTKN